MTKLIVKNGIVFDPINDVKGEVKDILIEDGKIVEKLSNEKNVKEINAKDKTVIPSGIDIHTHIASQQINWVRLVGKTDKTFQEYWNNLRLDYIARDYISNGYTFIVEANVYPSLSKQTIFNFQQFPVLDKAILLNISNFWPLELEFQREMEEQASVFLSDLLTKTKGFGFKIYNPFEAENWNFHKLRDSVEDKGRLYNFSPIDVYEKLAKYNEYLGLPHSVHAHVAGYEKETAKQNLSIILERIRALNLTPNPKNDLNIDRTQIFHLAHASTYNIDGDNSNLINFFNDNQDFCLDLGILGFDPINPLITSDRRLINSINSSASPFKLITMATESEGDSFSTLRTFSKKHKDSCIYWANALSLALNIKNKWQIQLSLNFPNYSHIKNIPEIASWLMSRKAREEFQSNMNQEFLKNNLLKNEEKELNFNEYIIISRSSPAKSLGIGSIKGNLGINADGDINILNLNINEIDTSKDYQLLEESFKNIEFVIKGGKVIKHQMNMNTDYSGQIFWSKGKIDSKDANSIINKKKEFYQKYMSVFYDTLNYSIDERYLREII
ncbi:MAG: amidohydrolase family protein [Candidatus Hodarchaeota archaeon]